MKEIQLTQGKVAIVDDADFEYLNQWRWFAHKGKCARTFYARRQGLKSNGKLGTILMHQVIAGNDVDQIDHIDGDGLNNQRHNLRPATTSQNNCNRGVQANNTSGYKGVYWNKRDKKWHALIGIDGKQQHLGYFDAAEEGALAYDQAARELHGEFSRTNFEQEGKST